jgi:UDP-galactopyranose mutase
MSDKVPSLPPVVFCGDVPWHQPHSGTHSYFGRLSRLTETIYVDPPLSILHIGRRPGVAGELARRVAASFSLGRGFEHETDRITWYRPMPVWPSGLVFERSSNAYYHRLARKLRNAMDERGIKHPVLWTCDPSSYGIIAELNPVVVIYHCIQDFAAAPLPRPIKRLKLKQEVKLAKTSDFVFAQTASLTSRLSRWNPDSHCFPSAVDTELFDPGREKRPAEPEDMVGLASPRICWIGMVSRAVDIDLLIDAARNQKRGTMVIIGGVQESNPKFDQLVSMPNVAYLGFKTHSLLPSYLANVDVCLIPYLQTPFVEGVSSQKLYEYFAMGCKVVATPFPESLQFSSALWLAKARDDFTRQVSEALAEVGRRRQERAIAIGKANSLDARLASMLDLIHAKVAGAAAPFLQPR